MTPQSRQIFFLALALPLVASAQIGFAPPVNYSLPYPSRPAFADFNRDGRIDMAVLSTTYDNTQTPTAVSLLIYPGVSSPAGTFGTPSSTLVSIQFPSNSMGVLAAGDFNNDGKQDLLGANTQSPFILLGNGDGTFGTPRPVLGSLNIIDAPFIVADFNNDGNLDFAYGQNFGIRYGRGDGTFQSQVSVFPSCQASLDNLTPVTTSYFLADLNRDGRLDAITGCSGTGASVAYRNADNTFASPVALSSFPAQVAVADFNNDSINDVFLYGVSQQVIRYGAADGSLLAPAAATVPPIPTPGNVAPLINSLVATDINFDGITDLLLNTESSIEILSGTGNGFFSTFSSISLGRYRPTNSAYILQLQDINGDGSPDLPIARNAAGVVSLYFTQPPSVFLTSSNNPVITGTNVTLTANVASQRSGVFYTNTGTVTFYSNSLSIGSGPLQNGQVTLNTNTLPPGVNYITAVYRASAVSPAIASSLLTVIVTPSACGLGSASSGVTPVARGIRFDRATSQFVQDVDLVNNSTTPVAGPISLLLAGLSGNATLVNPAGVSTCTSPGAPVVDSGLCPGSLLAPGQSTRITLRFRNPSGTAISYSPQTVAGLGIR